MPAGGKVRFAVAGCGAVSEMHSKGIIDTEDAGLVAVCDRVEANARQVADRYNARGHIDVLCICTPSGVHPDQAILAAEAGKHLKTPCHQL